MDSKTHLPQQCTCHSCGSTVYSAAVYAVWHLSEGALGDAGGVGSSGGKRFLGLTRGGRHLLTDTHPHPGCGSSKTPGELAGGQRQLSVGVRGTVLLAPLWGPEAQGRAGLEAARPTPGPSGPGTELAWGRWRGTWRGF